MSDIDLNTNKLAFIENNVVVQVMLVSEQLAELFLSNTQKIDFSNFTNADLVIPGDIYDPETNTIINVDRSSSIIEYPDRRDQ
jgi:hypothetical protein